MRKAEKRWECEYLKCIESAELDLAILDVMLPAPGKETLKKRLSRQA